MSEATRRRSGHGRGAEMDLGKARSVSLRTVQAVPDTIMPAGHDAFQTHFTERLRLSSGFADLMTYREQGGR
jgi:hypothetical protein